MSIETIDREHFIGIIMGKMKYESDLGIREGLQFAIDKARELPDENLKNRNEVYAFWKFKEDRAIVDGKDWVCSDCGKAQRCKENYCPNCGAKMVEE